MRHEYIYGGFIAFQGKNRFEKSSSGVSAGGYGHIEIIEDRNL